MKTVKVLCAGCSKKFDKRVADYNRTERRGGKHFCSLSCSVSVSNKTVNRGNVDNFHGIKPNLIDEYTNFRWFLARIRSRVKKSEWKKGSTDLTLEYIKDIWEKQQGVCPWTGKCLVLPNTTQGWNNTHRWDRASIDRIDNTKGYVKGNIRFVSLMANFIKGRFSDIELIEFCKAVAARH